ncbi:hypothetical protein CPSG_06302 [Coccidioides posadasii str. Silveira]|uniref:Uncharacterized protein n=1 Tax=Coccidioides posadasii (strain RMSCC 757 / Silveira) TaxID=443226 RepID=E9D900_COCPS|nr:hypothetical protein CPSG_06302 [Coccidioides posadasii str. Silveira]
MCFLYHTHPWPGGAASHIPPSGVIIILQSVSASKILSVSVNSTSGTGSPSGKCARSSGFPRLSMTGALVLGIAATSSPWGPFWIVSPNVKKGRSLRRADRPFVLYSATS